MKYLIPISLLFLIFPGFVLTEITGIRETYREKTSRLLPDPEGKVKDFQGLDFVSYFLKEADKIEIYFPKRPVLVYEREEIIPQYVISDKGVIERIASFMSEKSEYVIAIGKLPAAEIARSGRIYLYVKNQLVMTISFYKNRANLSVVSEKIAGKTKESDILFVSRKINPEGEAYFARLFHDAR